jgi:hypothetical protein
MTRGPLSFKETDLVRAIKSAVKAGLAIARLEVDPQSGKIVIIAGKATEPEETGNPWDKALGHDEH